MERLVPRQALEELRQRRDERVLVADDVARAPEIGEHRVRHVRDENVTKPLLGGRIRCVEEFQVVEPLEVEAEHAARPVDFERVLVLAPDGEPRGLERAGAPVLEPDERHHGVVDGAVRGDRARVGDPLDDRPIEIQRGIEKVREEVVGNTRPRLRRVHPPRRRARGVGAPLLPVCRVVVEDRAEPSLVDQLPRERDRGHPTVVEPDERRPPLRRVDHRAAFFGGERERLLAKDDLPRLRGGDRGFRVQVVRQRDVDDVDVLAVDGRAPVGGGLLPAPAIGGAGQGGRVAAAQQRAAEAVRQVVEVPGLAVGVRMGLAHESLAEQGDTQLRFHPGPFRGCREKEAVQRAAARPVGPSGTVG
jgi:hypothetical protein